MPHWRPPARCRRTLQSRALYLPPLKGLTVCARQRLLQTLRSRFRRQPFPWHGQQADVSVPHHASCCASCHKPRYGPCCLRIRPGPAGFGIHMLSEGPAVHLSCLPEPEAIPVRRPDSAKGRIWQKDLMRMELLNPFSIPITLSTCLLN